MLQIFLNTGHVLNNQAKMEWSTVSLLFIHTFNIAFFWSFPHGDIIKHVCRYDTLWALVNKAIAQMVSLASQIQVHETCYATDPLSVIQMNPNMKRPNEWAVSDI